MSRNGVRLALLVACAFALPAAASAAPIPQAYQQNGVPGFRDVLPAGTNGLVTATDFANFTAFQTRPPHSADQRDMYANLVYVAPHMATSQIPNFFKDSSFGVQAGNVERTYSPRDDVTIQRDNFGVPHVYGATRAGAMFGLGYIAAEDRLFLIDLLRRAARSQLSSFAGGNPSNRAFERDQWRFAPYNEADFQKQFDLGDEVYGAQGAQLQQDSIEYSKGVNTYIVEAKSDPTKLPVEYPAVGQTTGPNCAAAGGGNFTGPDCWKPTDIIALASLVAGQLGRGGGAELEWARLLQGFQQRLGAVRGKTAWLQLRAPDDPAAPTTVHNGTRFPYRTIPKRPASGSVAMPDPGSVTEEQLVINKTGSAAQRGVRGKGIGLPGLPQAASNALLVSAPHSASGHPIVVFGPQVAYWAPQILMEQDVHAPTLDASGVAFPGTNLFVQIGHGRDYAWSATSAGQDITDTFAVDLCNPNGGHVSKDSKFYVFRGHCTPMETLTRTNSWTPNVVDDTPAGSETLVAERTKLGLVSARATIGGKPVAYTKLRSTYFHEADSSFGFSDLNNPDKIRSPQDFQHAVSKIGFTFNWFYEDDKHIAYFNSGFNPVRAPNTDPLLPVRAAFEWRNYDPELGFAAYTPAAEHPQVVDQDYLTSWNNKQAPGFNAPDTDATYTSIYRSQPLDDRVRAGIKNGRRMTLTELINAMEDAGTVDLRGDKVLPWALKVIGRSSDPTIAAAVNRLAAWQRSGAHRRDLDHNGAYDDSDAVFMMDAWWPRLVSAVFAPTLGHSLYEQLLAEDPVDNHPNNNGDHFGSAWDQGIYGSVQEDLRRVLAAAGVRSATASAARSSRRRTKRKRPAPAVTFCGGGNLTRCRAALESSLRQALTVDRATLYHDPGGGCTDGDQMCFDEVRFQVASGIAQTPFHWINRPTYQQANELLRPAPR
ncbi:MAG: hypothetical protein QOK04_812 [Solirubrobacteraceae bacterium]|nr:hypothetical protein [Solirubrobacteraceae bacterium]